MNTWSQDTRMPLIYSSAYRHYFNVVSINYFVNCLSKFKMIWFDFLNIWLVYAITYYILDFFVFQCMSQILVFLIKLNIFYIQLSRFTFRNIIYFISSLNNNLLVSYCFCSVFLSSFHRDKIIEHGVASFWLYSKHFNI